MDNLSRMLGWMLMQLFTLKWSWFWFWFFVPIAKEQYFMESNPGASSCGQAAGQSPSRLPGLFVAMLEELRNLGDHRRDFWEGRGVNHGRWLQISLEGLWMSWENLAVAVWAITGTRFGVGSRVRYLGPWSQRLSRNHGGYDWHASSCYSQVCYLHSDQGLQSPAWWCSHSGIP